MITFWLIFFALSLLLGAWSAHKERRANANWASKLHLPRHGYGKYLLLLLLLLPTSASAAFYQYDCADASLFYAGSTVPTCTDTDLFTFPNNAASVTDNHVYFTFVDNTDYYITYTASRNGNAPYDGRFYFNGDGGTVQFLWQSGTHTTTLNSGTVGSAGSKNFAWYASTAGTVQSICIDDDGVSCTPPPAVPVFIGLFSSFWFL